MKGWSRGSTMKLPPPLFVVAGGIGSSIPLRGVLVPVGGDEWLRRLIHHVACARQVAVGTGSFTGWTLSDPLSP